MIPQERAEKILKMCDAKLLDAFTRDQVAAALVEYGEACVKEAHTDWLKDTCLDDVANRARRAALEECQKTHIHLQDKWHKAGYEDGLEVAAKVVEEQPKPGSVIHINGDVMNTTHVVDGYRYWWAKAIRALAKDKP